MSKIVGRAENSVDPDQTPRSAASDLGLLFAKAPLSEYLWLPTSVFQ